MKGPAVLLVALALLPAAPPAAAGEDPAPAVHLSRFGEGPGPVREGDAFRLLDGTATPGQSNAVALDRAVEGPRESVRLTARMRVPEGGHGGAFLLLSTAEYGARGPAPFVPDWTAPNLRGTLAVGIDTHDPRNEDPFTGPGNYRGMPEREVSLHWDGREIVKRVAPEEFRGEWADVEVLVEHAIGGADVTVRLAGAAVHEREFVPGLLPHECRPAVGAGTAPGAAGSFDVADLRLEAGPPAAPRRRPVRIPVFNHVLTDNSRTAFEAEVDLPPAVFAFGRVLLDLEIHDAGDAWDEWDRCGEFSLVEPDGTRRGLVPFITSYRTPCRWVVDVTDFRPWLAGKRRFEIAAGTTFYKNRGYMMSAALEFHHGVPEREPFRVIPVWNGTARYRSDANAYADFFTPVEVPVDGGITDARLRMTTTGHSQVGEFTPHERTFAVLPDAAAGTPGEVAFEDTLWKDDCYLNPNRPQYGTWKYSRAGWAPGDVVRPRRFELGGVLLPGKTARFTCTPRPYAFPGEEEPPTEKQKAEASLIVRSFLVLYRRPAALVPAPVLRIVNLVGGGNAARAGVKEGDWLAAYGERRLESLDDLRAAIAAAGEAGKAEGARRPVVEVWRGGERLLLEVDTGRLGVGLAER